MRTFDKSKVYGIVLLANAGEGKAKILKAKLDGPADDRHPVYQIEVVEGDEQFRTIHCNSSGEFWIGEDEVIW